MMTQTRNIDPKRLSPAHCYPRILPGDEPVLQPAWACPMCSESLPTGTDHQHPVTGDDALKRRSHLQQDSITRFADAGGALLHDAGLGGAMYFHYEKPRQPTTGPSHPMIDWRTTTSMTPTALIRVIGSSFCNA